MGSKLSRLIVIAFGLVFLGAIAVVLLLVRSNWHTTGSVKIDYSPVEITKISEENLKKNFFQSLSDRDFLWVSVSKGGYNGQFYSRDTFVTFMGAVQASGQIRETVVHALDWFGEHQRPDGYIPIWFAETTNGQKLDLNSYYFAPFNRTAETGGIEQYDHVEEFIHAIYLNFEKTRDVSWLASHIKYAQKAWDYLNGKSRDNLLVEKYSDYAGADWADQVRRDGAGLFVNAYWYVVTRDMTKMGEALGLASSAQVYSEIAGGIKRSFNDKFWVVSKPINCVKGVVGHYAGWVDEIGVHDYFEVDGNTLAVAAGLADGDRGAQVMRYINRNFDYFVNKNGATRVLCGHYAPNDTAMAEGLSQNGGYWYIASYYLAAAEEKMGRADYLAEIWNRTAMASFEYRDNGLTEWYDGSGVARGAMNYSWSLAFPIYVNGLLSDRTWEAF